MHIIKGMRRFMAAVLLAAAITGAAVGICAAALPDTFYLPGGSGLSVASMPLIRVTPAQRQTAAAKTGSTGKDRSENCTLALFGVLPVKTVRAVSAARRTVQVSGIPFGIKMFSRGALVVAFSDQYTIFGAENPAKEAGLRLGDLIISANGKNVRANEELTAAITEAQGGPLQILYLRGGAQRECTLTPVADRSTGAYRAGIWVRDSSAGIGTLTFADPYNNSFAGLGHSISDTDTGADIPLLSGEITSVTITGSIRGAAGAPGELRGEFVGDTVLGTVYANDATGIYGVLGGAIAGESYPVAEPQEVALGAAQIVTTVLGNTPQTYDAVIERVNMTATDPNRNMLLRITDKTLLETTGGIVQGMSGSPILQNGRLIGAVTHVLVNDPARGYAIFAKTMLEKADTIEKK